MRRACLAVPLLLALCMTASAQPASESRRAVVSVGLADSRWTTGFWADRFEVCRKTTIPAMLALMKAKERSQFLHNFRIAAGLADGTHRGPPWNDGDFYKWLEAAAAVYAINRDPALDRQLDEAIAIIAKAQRDDGYLHTPVLIKNRNGDASAKPFADRFNFEMYNFGHLLTAACVHHRATGKKTLLAVALKAADFLEASFKSPTPELARNSVCPSHYMGAIELYRTTGDPKHLTLARKLFEMRDQVKEGTDDNQDRIPFRKQTEAVGHAVRANYLYAGAADLYLETGDRTLLEPLEKIWANVVGRKLYITGACGALFDGASPDGSKEQKTITRVHQSYGRDYQLPNSTAHNETCAAIGNALWNWRMFQITGDARYTDVLERTLYNAVLAGVSLDGTRFFYTNTLRQLDSMPTALRWSRQREEWISCFCCPPNVARTIAQVHTFAYGRSADAIWVNLYGGSTLDTQLPNGGRVKLTQSGDYPWDGRIKFEFTAIPDRQIALKLRIPAWANGATLAVNGKPLPKPAPGSYAEVRRRWTVGDVVELTLPLTVRLLESHPLVEETRNQIAVQCGPIVYCLESKDLDPGTRILDVAIPPSIELTPHFEPRLLGGVVTLSGKIQADVPGEWKDDLYREVRQPTSRTVPIKLIPYYAWGNRGASEMTVWLPRGR